MRGTIGAASPMVVIPVTALRAVLPYSQRHVMHTGRQSSLRAAL
jgi:hypothetical protein